MILVICAAAAELRGFARAGVTVAAVGVGPVEAAIGTLRALGGAHYDLVVNAGIGGGFADRAMVGDAVAITSDTYVELGREDGGDLSLPGGLQLAVTAAADPALLAQLRVAALPQLTFGPAVTSATISTSAGRAQDLAARYTPIVESMEGFAVLRAAAVMGITALEVRGISNIVGDRASAQWDFRAGAAATVRALAACLDVVKPEA